MQQFVHLGIHTEFSITESIVRIPDLIKAAVKQEMPALALTDLSNLHAAVKFYKSCLGKGIKPILGSTIRLNDAEHKATLLAIDNHGWRSITELVSQGYIEGQQLDIPCVQKEWILNQHEGIIVLLGIHSDVGQLLCSSNPQKLNHCFKSGMKNLAIGFTLHLPAPTVLTKKILFPKQLNLLPNIRLVLSHTMTCTLLLKKILKRTKPASALPKVMCWQMIAAHVYTALSSTLKLLSK
jgi:DNA polymerase III alpha subunit